MQYKLFFGVVGLVLITTFSNLSSFAAPGILDSTFGQGGLVKTSFGGTYDSAYAVAIQADGKVVVAGAGAGGSALARYNSDGSLDTSFGTGGKVTTLIGSGCYPHSIAIQSDGKIVAAGGASYSDHLNFAVCRYNPDGSLDAGFGNGGAVITQMGNNTNVVNSVAIQPDGKIVAGGWVANNGLEYFALARYNPDGSLDPGFGSGGKVITRVTNTQNEEYADSIAIQTDGKIVAGGISNADFALVRYNPDGTLDSGFGNGGKVITDLGYYERINSIAVQSDGKIMIAGSSHISNTGYYVVALVRHLPDGTLDNTFGSEGIVTTTAGRGSSVAIQSNGKVVVAGYASGHPDFALFRYNSNGSVDYTYGQGGTALVDFGDNDVWYSSPSAVTLDREGRAVVVGSYQYCPWDCELSQFAIARVLGDPVAAPSSQYQLSGRVTTPDGRGLRNASVSITDSLGVRRTTTTSSFGFFTFDHLALGDTDTIAAASKRYRFASQTIQITGNLTNVNFVALE